MKMEKNMVHCNKWCSNTTKNIAVSLGYIALILKKIFSLETVSSWFRVKIEYELIFLMYNHTLQYIAQIKFPQQGT